MDFDPKTIERHQQKFEYSCIPSAIEIVLKLLKKVDINYYDLQDKWNNKKDGNFSDFNGKTIKGLIFEHKFSTPRGDNFPLDQLFQTIDTELNSGRSVIISLSMPGGWHNYVIFKREQDKLFACTKFFNNPYISFEEHVKDCVRNMKGTDILVYKEEKDV